MGLVVIINITLAIVLATLVLFIYHEAPNRCISLSVIASHCLWDKTDFMLIYLFIQTPTVCQVTLIPWGERNENKTVVPAAVVLAFDPLLHENIVGMQWVMCVLFSSGCYNKIPIVGNLNHRHFFLTVPDAGKFKVRVPAGSGCWWRLSSWLAEKTAFCCVFTWGRGG